MHVDSPTRLSRLEKRLEARRTGSCRNAQLHFLLFFAFNPLKQIRVVSVWFLLLICQNLTLASSLSTTLTRIRVGSPSCLSKKTLQFRFFALEEKLLNEVLRGLRRSLKPSSRFLPTLSHAPPSSPFSSPASSQALQARPRQLHLSHRSCSQDTVMGSGFWHRAWGQGFMIQI